MSYEARHGAIVDVPPGPAGETGEGLVLPLDVEELGDWTIFATYRDPRGSAFRYREPLIDAGQYVDAFDNRAPLALRVTWGRDAAAFRQTVAVPVVGLALRCPSRPSRVEVIRQKSTAGEAGSPTPWNQPTPCRLTIGLLPYSPSDVRYPLTLVGPNIVPTPPEAAPGFELNPVKLPRFARRVSSIGYGQTRTYEIPFIPDSGGTVVVQFGPTFSGRFMRLAAAGNITGFGIDADWLGPAGEPRGSFVPDVAQWHDIPNGVTGVRFTNNNAFGILPSFALWQPGETAVWLDAEGLNEWPVDTDAVHELAESMAVYSDPLTGRVVEGIA